MRPLQSLPLRQAIVQRLRSDAPLAELLPMTSIYGQRSPAVLTWPFIRTGAPNEVPIRKGTQIRFSIHVFSKQQFEDEVSNIGAAVQNSIEDAVLDLGDGFKAFLTFIASQILPDAAEADAWHALLSFNATIG